MGILYFESICERVIIGAVKKLLFYVFYAFVKLGPKKPQNKTNQNQTNQTQEKTTTQKETKPKQKPKTPQTYQNPQYNWNIIGFKMREIHSCWEISLVSKTFLTRNGKSYYLFVKRKNTSIVNVSESKVTNIYNLL